MSGTSYKYKKKKSEKEKGLCLMPTRTDAEKSRLFIQELCFQHLHSAIHYQPQNNRAQETNEQHEQEIQRCEARFREQMVQELLYFIEGHSLCLYTSFIKLDLNWCSHPDSRNHHTYFPFKRGNKHLISKAVSIRGSLSPFPGTLPHKTTQAELPLLQMAFRGAKGSSVLPVMA